MSTTRIARPWHLLTLVVAVCALVLQLVLIVQGQTVIDTGRVAAPTGEAVRRYFSYFTIQSNILVAVAVLLVVTDRCGTRAFRVVRLASLVGIAVTGVVAAVALQPPPTYTTANLLCDRLLHVVVPLLTVVGWIAFGPRGVVGRADVVPALAWPVLWLVATLGLGPVVDWYPYPFLDVARLGYPRVLLICLVVALVFIALAALAVRLDARLSRHSAAGEPVA